MLASSAVCDLERNASKSTFLDASIKNSAHRERSSACCCVKFERSLLIASFRTKHVYVHTCTQLHIYVHFKHVYRCKVIISISLQIVVFDHLVNRFPSSCFAFHIDGTIVSSYVLEALITS